ncbi:MAG TPA: hypothetical protein PLP27_10910 [Crocinitomicaceae bacterium]|nr:hypothetical protein [Crocinitomicaceae bacterium]
MMKVQMELTQAQYKQFEDLAKKNGVKIVTLRSKKIAPKKKEIDSNFLDNREQCKRLKNEMRRKYNEHAKIKVEYIV